MNKTIDISGLKIIDFQIILFAFALLSSLSAQELGTLARGIYFSKYQYEGRSLPTFTAMKELLPRPILQKNPEYIDLYWYAWELAFDRLKNPPSGSPLLSDYIEEPMTKNIMCWDVAAIVMFMRYAYPHFSAIEMLDNFYGRQHESGYICNGINSIDGSDVHLPGQRYNPSPPLFSWIEMEWYRFTGDDSRFHSILPVLTQYAAWMEKHLVKKGTIHGLFYNSGAEMNREGKRRLGSGWADISSQMVFFYQHLAMICKYVGLGEEAGRYRYRADEISANINQYLWNEVDGIYYDIDDYGTHIPYATTACFWPMIVGIATPQQAMRLNEALLDSSRFWRKVPFSSLDARHLSSEDEGQVGSVWDIDNYFLFYALEKYGYQQAATEAAESYLNAVSQVYKTSGSIWENYAADQLAAGSAAKPDWVGSGLCPIAGLLEHIIGIRIDAVNHRLTWQLRRTDKHGVENLACGSAIVSMVCQPRKWPTERAWIRLETTAPIHIDFIHPLGKKSIYLKPGIREIAVPN